MALFFKKKVLELPPAPQRPVLQTEPKHISYLELPPPSPTQQSAAKFEAQQGNMPEFPPLPKEEIPPSVPPLAFKSQERPSMVLQTTQRKDLFVDVSEYTSVLDELDKIKSTIAKGQDSLNDLMSMKSEEDSEFEKWRNVLEDMERKLLSIDKTIFER